MSITSIIVMGGLFAALLVTLLVSLLFPRWACDNNAGMWFVLLVIGTSLYLGVTSYAHVFGV